MSSIYVVDASVALAWILPGEDTEQTLKLRDIAVDNHLVELFVPPVFWYEIANTLWVATKRNRLNKSDAFEALDALLDFQLNVRATNPAEDMQLSFKHNLAIYDSSYISVTMELGAKLWTLDKLMAKTAKKFSIPVEP